MRYGYIYMRVRVHMLICLHSHRFVVLNGSVVLPLYQLLAPWRTTIAIVLVQCCTHAKATLATIYMHQEHIQSCCAYMLISCVYISYIICMFVCSVLLCRCDENRIGFPHASLTYSPLSHLPL